MTKPPEEYFDLIRRILGNNYYSIKVKSIEILDNLENGVCHITLNLLSGITIIADGVGVVDAIFSGLKEHFSDRFNSLTNIELNKFFVKAKAKGTNAVVEVELEIKNSYGRYSLFVDNSQSLIASTTKVCVSAVEYYINAEKAFLLAHNALEDAKRRSREDLVSRFETELALLVENTSYSGALDLIK